MLRPSLSLSLTTQPSGGPVAPAPPSLAPVLEVTAELGSSVAELSWTPSNRIGSPGFGYKIFWEGPGGGGFTELPSTTTNTFFDDNRSGDDGVHRYYVRPFNNAGEGPDSNVAEITLPGESEAATYRRPDTTSRYLRPDGTSTYLRPAA